MKFSYPQRKITGKNLNAMLNIFKVPTNSYLGVQVSDNEDDKIISGYNNNNNKHMHIYINYPKSVHLFYYHQVRLIGGAVIGGKSGSHGVLILQANILFCYFLT